MNLLCVGLSHHTADVDVLGRFSRSADAASVMRSCGCAEALLLSTCNRVEVYAAAEEIQADEIVRCLSRNIDSPQDGFTGANSLAEIPMLYRHENADCAQHLFRVASGLDSMVVGETEILGQAKKAYESARSAGSAGPFLHRLFQRAFRVAKQVRTHTEISRGTVSIGSVAIDLAEKIFGDLADCRVLLVGAGETSERTARALVSRGAMDVRVSNRSIKRAEELARLVSGRTVPFEDWRGQCREIDILVTSTSSEMPLLQREDLQPILRQRIDRPLFIIDLAVPRDVDPGINELEGVYLYDLDSLQSVAQQSLAQRRHQVAAAEEIIAQHVAEFTEQISRGLNWRPRSSEHPLVGDTSLRTSEL